MRVIGGLAWFSNARDCIGFIRSTRDEIENLQ
jgi:hypothetical protein